MIEAQLREHRFLAGLEPAHVAVLARHAREARFRTDELLLREGEAANATFLLVAGRVALEVRASAQVHQLATAGPGEVVGWSWLAAPNRWHFDARALEPVEAVVLDGAGLIAECERDGALGFALTRRFLQVVTKRLEAVRLQLLDLYGPRERSLPWA